MKFESVLIQEILPGQENLQKKTDKKSEKKETPKMKEQKKIELKEKNKIEKENLICGDDLLDMLDL